MSLATFMKRLKRRHWLMLLVAAALGSAIVVVYLRATENRLTVVNRSGQAIGDLEIRVTGSPSVIKFRDIPDGGMASSTFRIGGDGDFQVTGRLADGTKLNGGLGYVTGGMYGVRARLVVQRGGQLIFSE